MMENMPNPGHPAEKLVRTVAYRRVEFEVVERLDVLWVGCVDYADNNTHESDIAGTLGRFQALVKGITDENDTRQLMCPGWSAALSQALQKAAEANGYRQNPDVHVQVEYHCHAEYGKRRHTNYAYIPIVKA